MKKPQLRCPIAPMILIILASLANISIGILPYLKPELLKNQDITQFALFATGILCLVAVFFVLINPVKIKDDASEKGKKEKEAVISAAPPPEPPKNEVKNNDQAILLLSLLQEKGKFIDFVMGDIAHYNNEQIGAAARVVHQGCRDLIIDCFHPEKICLNEENSEVTLNENFNTIEYKIIGNVIGNPPYTGKLLHKGWKAGQVKLPRLNLPKSESDTPVIHPAEIEL